MKKGSGTSGQSLVLTKPVQKDSFTSDVLPDQI